ncbi:MAG: VirB4 family type IV secretion/conjugal transfer ATPase [Caulobacteraceae bacterium]
MTDAPLTAADRLRLWRREKGIADMLPYVRHVDDATLLTRDGSLMQVIKIDGMAFETADSDDLNYRKNVRNTMLRAIASSRLSLYHHVVRRRVSAEVSGAIDTPFANTLDVDWRQRMAERRLYVNDLYITLLRKPAPLRSGLLGDLFGRGADTNAASLVRELRELDAARDSVVASLAAYKPRLLTTYEARGRRYSELIEFLGCTFDGELRPRLMPAGEVGEAIAQRRLSFGLDMFELSATGDSERAFAAMIAVKEYPPHTAPGQLDGLFALPCELTLTESFAFVDRQIALDRMNLALRRMRAADDDALSLRRDLSAAKDDAAAGRQAFGEHHLTIMVKASSPRELDERVADAQAAFTEVGAISVREDVAMEPSFWAQFPGNGGFIPRKALVSSANFAGLASGHNHPTGKAEGNHWGPAVTVLETTAASPYHFNFHHGDLGNFLIIGPSGAGKTVLLNFLLAQAQRFSPRLVFFDKDRSAEIFLRAMGARYDVLRAGSPSGMNPLQLSDTPDNRRFLHGWTAKLLTSNGETLSADDMQMIAEAVSANFEQATEFRRLRYFRELFAGARRPTAGDLAARLLPWVGKGDRAWLFDNDADRLDLDARMIGFDMTQLLDDAVGRTPAMMYLFHRVEERLDGEPSIIVVDEGWRALDDDVFVARIRDWEKTIRKRNGIVGFSTQSARDALDSRIANAIIEQSPTQIFLPNPKAQAKEYCEGFGLSEHEFEIIAALPDSSRCFLIRRGGESVVARLDLSGMKGTLGVLSGRERSIRLLDELRAETGDTPSAWLPRFLDRVG